MALYSPAYLLTAIDDLGWKSPAVIHVDRNSTERNFTATFNFKLLIKIFDLPNNDYKSNFRICQTNISGAYAIRIDNISIICDAYTGLRHNNINFYVPTNENSNLIFLDFINFFSVSQLPIANQEKNYTSNADTLSQLYDNNLNDFKNDAEKVIINPFYNRFSSSRLMRMPINRKLDFPLNYGIESTQPDFFINAAVGVGQPHYNMDVSQTGNALAEGDLSIVDNPYHTNNFGNNGNWSVFRDLSEDAYLSTQVTDITVYYNVIVQGQILK